MNHNEMKEQFEEQWGELLFEAFPCGIYCVEYTKGKGMAKENFHTVYINEEFYRCIGYRQEEFAVAGNDVGIITVKEDKDIAKQQVWDAMAATGAIIYQDYRIHKPDGGITHVLCCIKDVEGQADSHLLVCIYNRMDAFLEKNRISMEQQVRMEEITSRLSRMIQKLPSGCAVLQGGDNWELVSANEEFFAAIGYTMEEIRTMPNDFYDILYREDVPKLKRVMEEALQRQDTRECEFRICDKNGKSHWIAVQVRFYYYQERIPCYLISSWNIHTRKMMEEKLISQTERDPLTKLLNKAALQAEIESFLLQEPAGEHAVFLIDIDNFKAINDTFGHLFGDNVLVNIADKIKDLFRSTDIIGRIGGDEFMVLMKHASLAQARLKAQNICDSVRQSYQSGQGDVEISSSVGVAIYGEMKESYTALFSKADMAMYQAKEAGKNQYRVAEIVDPMWKIRKGTGIENREGRYAAGKKQDMDFLSEAFQLLSHAKDMNNSLNLLMERIGRQYDLGMVAVLECDRERKELFQTNCWTRARGILLEPQFIDKYEEWTGFASGFDEWGLSYIDDCFGGEGVSESDREVFRERHIHALVNCSFSYYDLGEGYITFCDMEKPRIWSEFEKETFLELSKMLSVFVALRQQKEEDQKAIRSLKRRDALTGLYNEKAFKSKVKKIMANWRTDVQYAMVYTDINDFSYINDNFGHDVGNKLLKKFGTQLTECENMVSCRLYSDLFVSFLWDKDRDTILEHVIHSSLDFSRQQKEKFAAGNVRLSTGIYFMEDKNESIDIAIENANITRKSLKGSNSIFCRVYEEQMRKKREDEKRVLSEFQKALEENRLKVYIQPKFFISDFNICGGEALVRWQTKSGRIEYPGAFIPALEKSEYIIELDFYIYEQVLSHLKKWKEEGRQLYPISVNFSRRHFENEGIYRRVVELAEAYDVEPQFIEVEITESLFAEGYEKVKQDTLQLRKAGFRIAIDDFGTGYSSLSMLLDIPADIVKMDKSFLNRENCQDEREFIKNMGKLIRSAKEEVIFEGIETEEQREFLKNCGFRYGQGFLFDRPLPIAVFEEKYMK